MGAEENRRAVETMFAELSRGNAQPLLDTLAEDVVFTLVGSTRFSGVCRGRDEFVRRVLEPLGAALDGGIVVQVKVAIADGDRVATLSKGSARAKDGRSYDNDYAHFFRFANGRIVEAVEVFDTQLTADRLR